VLSASQPEKKVAAAHNAAALLRGGYLQFDAGRQSAVPPLRPARPAAPVLVDPRRAPRRRITTQAGRIALLHAVAHIEFNAIDLAFDMAARFAGEINHLGLDPREFAADWFAVGDDEARHFQLICDRLAELGAQYGDLPAHDGLWEAAEATADSLPARLAIAPMVLEARGLDVTPPMIEKLTVAGDLESAAVLQVIYKDEIGHVATGVKWFRKTCEATGEDMPKLFKSLVKSRYGGSLKPPFNEPARRAAGLLPALYEPDH